MKNMMFFLQLKQRLTKSSLNSVNYESGSPPPKVGTTYSVKRTLASQKPAKRATTCGFGQQIPGTWSPASDRTGAPVPRRPKKTGAPFGTPAVIPGNLALESFRTHQPRITATLPGRAVGPRRPCWPAMPVRRPVQCAHRLPAVADRARLLPQPRGCPCRARAR